MSNMQIIPQPHDDVVKRLRILCSRVFDPESLEFVNDQAITISRVTGLITDVSNISNLNEQDTDRVDVIDLRATNVTLLPGFIDAHVHLFLHWYHETTWHDQVTRESTVERTIRAVRHAKDTLMAGFTTVRDLGTEGAEDADVDLRKCISNPMAIIPGPRLFITNRAIVSSGSYGPKGNLRPNSEGVDGKTGGQVADGEAECIRVVRNQIGAGVDWIKIYADYPFRSRLSSVSPKQARKDLTLFSEKELKAMIDTAHSLGVKVAAHTLESSTIRTLIPLGIDSIEHGLLMDEDTLKLLRDTNGRTTWVPTLAVCTPVGPMPRLFEQASRTFANALKIGNIKIACGGDTGTFPHGHNALEMLTMIRLGDDWKEVLRKGTLGGWECIRGMDWEGEKGISRLASFQKAASKSVDPEQGETDETAFREIGEWPLGDNDVPLGALKPGFAADIIAISGEFSSQHNVLETLGEFGPKVMFVMKGGKIYKMNGVELPNPH